jgi:hypothetical protein
MQCKQKEVSLPVIVQIWKRCLFLGSLGGGSSRVQLACQLVLGLCPLQMGLVLHPYWMALLLLPPSPVPMGLASVANRKALYCVPAMQWPGLPEVFPLCVPLHVENTEEPPGKTLGLWAIGSLQGCIKSMRPQLPFCVS